MAYVTSLSQDEDFGNDEYEYEPIDVEAELEAKLENARDALRSVHAAIIRIAYLSPANRAKEAPLEEYYSLKKAIEQEIEEIKISLSF